MTLRELLEVNTWDELQSVMRDHEYYDDLDGDLYLTETDLLDGVMAAARYEWGYITDIQRTEFDCLDSAADAWVCSADFSYVQNLYDNQFDDIFTEFRDWMENNGLLDEDEEPEEDVEPYEEHTATNNSEAENENIVVSDISVETLLYGSCSCTVLE